MVICIEWFSVNVSSVAPVRPVAWIWWTKEIIQTRVELVVEVDV